MRIHLVSVSARVPAWVSAGYEQYATRLRGEVSLQLHEVALARRGRGDSAASLMRDEARRIATALPTGTHRVALEVTGSQWSTEQLRDQLDRWLAGGRDVTMLIGGPDGLDPALSASCEQHWSLSKLTLPHPLVRVIVAEQLYRAWSLLRGHPYHRG